MKAVIQRVKKASVTIKGELVSEISQGILVLVGIEESDNQNDIEFISRKITQLRIFDDANGVMNLSVKDIDGELLVVSQFTLQASIKKGNRPSYIKAAKPEISNPIYENFCKYISSLHGKACKRGVFGADMQVALINDGPVTIIMDSKNIE